VRKWWKRRRAPSKGTHSSGSARPPLREFVYLDDVSLRSLLASQKGELTEQVTDLLSQADEAELAASIGASTPLLKSEVKSRYSVSSGQGTQTVRKAAAQSLFKELRELHGVDLTLVPCSDSSGVTTTEELLSSGAAVPAADLRRGSLIELEVELVADPIFRFSTIASELVELARDFPEMLDQPAAREGMAMLGPGSRFIQRFLAGLVPLRAEATSHVVVTSGGIEYIVPASKAEALGLKTHPLIIVGVTEQTNYWRDVRRVLFARSQFTMLCRIARDGFWDSWEPVKLAEALREALPTFPDLIADLGRSGFAATQTSTPPAAPPLVAALDYFITIVGASGASGVTPDAIAAARVVASGAAADTPTTVTGQNEAFRLVVNCLQENGCELDPEVWRSHQEAARQSAGLSLFADQQVATPPVTAIRASSESDERLLDTEVIAIYW
jgi:hypothetical protein